jgi:glycosyltransferase involved in cell wall biosynthesis
MNQVYIVVQNLQIGGSQRIALDEAYGFAENGYSPILILLDDPKNLHLNKFLELERVLIEELKITVVFAGKSRFDQLNFFRSIIITNNLSLEFISHVLRGTVLIKLASLGHRPRVRVFTLIHQLPSLSSKSQRAKRFIYSYFSDHLFCYSEAVESDWNKRLNSLVFLKFLFGKKEIKVLRNGVYLNRLPNYKPNLNIKNSSEKRLVYLGRNIAWKGIDKVIDLAKHSLFSEYSMLFMLPALDEDFVADIPLDLLKRISFQVGKSFSSYEVKFGDIHIYPTNYGNNFDFIESVSINCLEMACIGVPSMITEGGLSTWPELQNSPFIVEVNWHNINEGAIEIKKKAEYVFSENEVTQVREMLNISHHINFICSYFKNR